MDYAGSARSGIPPDIGRVFRGGQLSAGRGRMPAAAVAGKKNCLIRTYEGKEYQCDAYCSEYPASPGIRSSTFSTFIVGLTSLKSVNAIAPGKIVMASFCIPTEGRVSGSAWASPRSTWELQYCLYSLSDIPNSFNRTSRS